MSNRNHNPQNQNYNDKPNATKPASDNRGSMKDDSASLSWPTSGRFEGKNIDANFKGDMDGSK